MVFNLCFTIPSFSQEAENEEKESPSVTFHTQPSSDQVSLPSPLAFESPSASISLPSPPVRQDLVRTLTAPSTFPVPSGTGVAHHSSHNPQSFNMNENLRRAANSSIPATSSPSDFSSPHASSAMGFINQQASPAAAIFQSTVQRQLLRQELLELQRQQQQQIQQWQQELQRQQELQQQLQKEYFLIVHHINVEAIPDAILRGKFFWLFYSGINLDTMHPAGQPPLAIVLMNVTLPKNWEQTNGGYRFRRLGNEITPVETNGNYDYSKAIFKGSKLEKRFIAALNKLHNPSTSCCAIL